MSVILYAAQQRITAEVNVHAANSLAARGVTTYLSSQ